MNISAALILFPIGMILGSLLTAAIIQVTDWSFLSLEFLIPLPFPLDQWVQSLSDTFFFTEAWPILLFVTLVTVVIVFISYWIASNGLPVRSLSPASPAMGLLIVGPAERIGRGMLIGFNAGMNYVLLLSLLVTVPGGLVISTILALINLGACVRTLSNHPVYQTVLSYATLLLPTAIPINVAGLITLVINAVAFMAGKPLSMFIDWRRANLVMYGGIVHGCYRTAFNMANFTVSHQDMGFDTPWLDNGSAIWSFCPASLSSSPGVRCNTVQGTLLHETAHTLNVGAFGCIYHLIGFADEFLPMPWSAGTTLGANAHAELTAESGLRTAHRNWIDMWTPGLAVAATSNCPAVGKVTPIMAAGMVVIAAGDTPIVACEPNRTIILDSTGSYDPDAYPLPLGRFWRIAPGLKPSGSTVMITTPHAPILSFIPDIGGRYVIDFYITDGSSGGPAGIPGRIPVTIHVLEAVISKPAGQLTVGKLVRLDRTRSITLPVGTPVFTWKLLQTPDNSMLTDTISMENTFVFVPDQAGNYEIELWLDQDIVPLSGKNPVTLSHSARTIVTVD